MFIGVHLSDGLIVRENNKKILLNHMADKPTEIRKCGSLQNNRDFISPHNLFE